MLMSLVSTDCAKLDFMLMSLVSTDCTKLDFMLMSLVSTPQRLCKVRFHAKATQIYHNPKPDFVCVLYFIIFEA